MASSTFPTPWFSTLFTRVTQLRPGWGCCPYWGHVRAFISPPPSPPATSPGGALARPGDSGEEAAGGSRGAGVSPVQTQRVGRNLAPGTWESESERRRPETPGEGRDSHRAGAAGERWGRAVGPAASISDPPVKARLWEKPLRGETIFYSFFLHEITGRVQPAAALPPGLNRAALPVHPKAAVPGGRRGHGSRGPSAAALPL